MQVALLKIEMIEFKYAALLQCSSRFGLGEVNSETHPAPGMSSATARPIYRIRKPAMIFPKRITKEVVGRMKSEWIMCSEDGPARTKRKEKGQAAREYDW